MGGAVDAREVGMQFQAQGGFVQHAAVGFLAGGDLIGAQAGGGGDGGLDEGELFAAGADGGKVGGVFVAKGVGGLEGGEEVDFGFFHGGFLFGCCGDYAPVANPDYTVFAKNFVSIETWKRRASRSMVAGLPELGAGMPI